MACPVKGTTLVSCSEYYCLLKAKEELDSKASTTSKAKLRSFPNKKVKAVCPT